MRLVDILAVELKSWPEGVSVLSQLRHNGAIINGRGYDGREWARLQIADDTPPAGVLVTEAQWQDAVDALYPKLSVPEEWNGEGLPPVGTHVEWWSIRRGWLGGTVVGHDGTATIVRHNDGYEGCYPDKVRPIRTPEQIAAEEREQAIDQMLSDAQTTPTMLTTNSVYFGALYDAGYRKQVKP